MALFKVICYTCNHEFFRVEVLCGKKTDEYVDQYECPECHGFVTHKAPVEREDKEDVFAPCSHANPDGTPNPHGCGCG